MSEPYLPGYEAAQREYDNRTPPDDGPCECSECNGNGYMPAPGDPEGDVVDCSACKGFGMLDERGEPFDPHAAEYAAAEYADYKREERKVARRDAYED